MNARTTEKVIEFFILVGAASYGAIKLMKYKKEEELRSQKKVSKSGRVERLSDKVIDVNSLKTEEMKELGRRFNSLSFIRKTHLLIHSDTNIDEDDIKIEEGKDYLDFKHFIRLEDNGDGKIYLRVLLPRDKSREYSEVADGILRDFKEENNMNPYIHKEGFVIRADEESVNWYEVTGYKSFSELVNYSKDNNDLYMFYTVDFVKDRISPEKLAELVERLLNNDRYEDGIKFGPVVFVDIDEEL